MSCPVEVHPHHVGIFTSDIERAIKWWEEMLGFKKMFEGEFFLPDYGNARMAWVKKDSFYIELYDFPRLAQDRERYWKTLGTKHVCLYVKDEDFEPLKEYLRSKGVKITVEAAHPPFKSGRPTECKVMFFDDPDGTTVEVQQECWPGEYPEFAK